VIVERDLQRQVQPQGLRAVQVRQRRRVLPRRGHAAASSAASGTTHGDTEVAKDFARNGPSGWLSQTWMSRALQSLTSMKPNVCSANSPAVTRWPGQNRPHDEADLRLEVEPPRRAEAGSSWPVPSGRSWPQGRVTGVPETTTDPARP
jgi:hypothetical protein